MWQIQARKLVPSLSDKYVANLESFRHMSFLLLPKEFGHRVDKVMFNSAKGKVGHEMKVLRMPSC